MIPSLRVLLVEDVDDDALLITVALRSFVGTLQQKRVEDEAEFRKALAGECWDLVLCDYSLPSFGALAALRILRESGMRIPFVIVSGAVGEEIAVEAIKQGADDFLNKGHLRGLQRVVERSLEDHRNRRRRQEVETALVGSEQRFREVVENIAEVFWIFEFPGRSCSYVSPGFERVWGRPASFLTSGQDAWVSTLHPDDRERVLNNLLERQCAGTYKETYRILRPDGSQCWIRDRAFPVKDEAGNLCRLVGVAEDITEQKRLEGLFFQSQRVEALGTLAGGVAHDLNNILSPILIGVGLLKPHIQEEEGKALLGMLAQQARRGAEIVKQLLTFSRRMDGQRSEVQLRPLVRDLEHLVRETFPREITSRFEVEADLWTVMSDPTQVHQVLLNLCVNARDAMPQGGQLEMEVRNVVLKPGTQLLPKDSRAGPYVELRVRDSGTGIPEDILPRIFDPYFTTKPQGKGTGLGLATVIGIVRAHEGFVTVESTLGEGTVFHVYLPASLSVSALPVRGPGEQPQPPAEQGALQCILVVDDEEYLRKALRLTLEGANYRVVQAANGSEALQVFDEHRDSIQLVITDLMMPVMGGLALIGRLRALRPGLPVIAASGMDNSEQAVALAQLGVNSVLMKPFDIEQILLEVGRILGRREPTSP